MKIGPEHIGRKICSAGGADLTILAYDSESDSLWCKDKQGECGTYANLGWELVEEPKTNQKPSQKIREIAKNRFGFTAQTVSVEFESICIYLDEVLPVLFGKK